MANSSLDSLSIGEDITLWIIGFIIKRNSILMLPSRISEFDIALSPDEPRVPHILHSKRRASGSQKLSAHDRQPEEVVIDARQFSYGRTPEQSSPFSEGIRAQIDTCLNAVEVVYQQQRLRREEGQRGSNKRQHDMPFVGENAIHRIDSALILDFLATIDLDYDIRNRFPDYRLTTKKKLFGESEGNGSKFASATKKAHKGFLNLTLSANSKQSLSAIKGKERDTYINKLLVPYSNKTDNNLQSVDSNIKQVQARQLESIKKVREEMRYCINCEQAILLQNIDFHERNECPNLKELYSLSFQELKQFVLQKIEKCKLQIRSNIQLMKREGRDGGSITTQFEQLCRAMLESMQSCVGGSEVDYSNQIVEFQHRYGRFQATTDNVFTESVELMRKLNSFMLSYSQLLRYRDQTVSMYQQSTAKGTPGVRSKANPEATTSVQQDQKRRRMPVVSHFGEGLL